MASTFGGIETAKSGLVAARTNIDVTGHNIANVNTPGYTRQRVITSAREPGQGTYLISQFYNKRVGQGVDILEIQQLRSSYLDQQYRDLNSNYMHSDRRVQGLTYLEGLLNELNVESSLTTSIENFFSALNMFSSDTSSVEFRTNVQQQALSMTNNFNIIYEEMIDLWHTQNESISVVANRINAIAKELKHLNEAIASYERSGQIANDLRDERNLLLDELSGLANITYSINSDNPSMLDVKIGGLGLVTGNQFNQITISNPSSHIEDINEIINNMAQINAQILEDPGFDDGGQIENYVENLKNLLGEYGQVDSIENSDGTTSVEFNGILLVDGAKACGDTVEAWVAFNRNYLTLDNGALGREAGTITGGQLYAHMEMITETGPNNSGIPYYMNQLNSLAREIAKNINEIHYRGYTYPGATKDTEVSFFEVPDGGYSQITAGNFTLSEDILSNVYNIAGSSEPVTLNDGVTETGNNIIALELFNDLNSSNYYGKLNSIVGHLAIAIDSSRSILDTRESLINSVDRQRTSISGVDLDEEATNLIVFQQSFDACARIITTIDEMLNTMINNMGRVGR
ncbi:MAG TPA: flagellar hook-associated protein FlgK [Clostridiales bacterium]|nr:flagellar hook-associated protein FlgK [Clostridiales bacterium]